MNILYLSIHHVTKSLNHFSPCFVFIRQVYGSAKESHILDDVSGTELMQSFQTTLYDLTAEAESDKRDALTAERFLQYQ